MNSSDPDSLELNTLLDTGCVAVHESCADDAEAIRRAAALLVLTGAVTEEYADAAMDREREFPTGLPTQPIGVALPHADHGVRRPAIALMTLQEPVLFYEMGTGERQIPVTLVIMLALPAGDAHVQAIGALAEIIQQPGFVEEVMNAQTRDQLYAVFQHWTTHPVKEGEDKNGT
jgi:PTS system galactitol-specific IIA component